MPTDGRLVALGAFLVAGLTITWWVFAPALKGAEAARKALGTHRLAVGSLVSVFVINTLVTLPFARTIGGQGLDPRTFTIGALGVQVPLLLVLYLRMVAPGAMTWQELGLRPLPRSRVLGVGIATAVGILVMNAAIGVVLDRLGLTHNQADLFSFVRNLNAPEFVLVLVLGSVTAPFAEEMFFRGYVFGTYLWQKPPAVAYAASGLLFAFPHAVPVLNHPERIAGLTIAIFAVGTVLAWTYRRTGSLYPGMVAHGVNNAVGLLALYAAGVS